MEQDLPLRVVVGNTSGDMDSIVGALGLAYYMHLKTKQMWTPIVNCAAADLMLKAEIYGHLIQDCGIKADDLFYTDDLIKSKRVIEETCLIDHNVIVDEQIELLQGHSKVTYVYDHHVDTKFYPKE
tara:strand:+ start:197 stop:574 length:378 start_codon:yes stop_codon:yes gene_type:complete